MASISDLIKKLKKLKEDVLGDQEGWFRGGKFTPVQEVKERIPFTRAFEERRERELAKFQATPFAQKAGTAIYRFFEKRPTLAQFTESYLATPRRLLSIGGGIPERLITEKPPTTTPQKIASVAGEMLGQLPYWVAGGRLIEAPLAARIGTTALGRTPILGKAVKFGVGVAGSTPILSPFISREGTWRERFQPRELAKATAQDIATAALFAGALKPISKALPEIKIPKELEPLAEEARKYKSAEEFEESIKHPAIGEFILPTGKKVNAGRIRYLFDEMGIKTFSDFYNLVTKGTKETPKIKIKPEAEVPKVETAGIGQPPPKPPKEPPSVDNTAEFKKWVESLEEIPEIKTKIEEWEPEVSFIQKPFRYIGKRIWGIVEALGERARTTPFGRWFMESRGLLKPVEEILDQRRLLIQGQQQRISEELITPISKLKPEEQRAIGESLQRIDDFFKEAPTSLSRKAREELARWGNAARKVGLLKDEQFFKNVGRYFPFFYSSKEYQKLSNAFGVKPLKLSDLGYAKKKLTDAEMGGWSLWQEIKGASYGKKQVESFAQKLTEEAKREIAETFSQITGHDLPSYSADNLFKANKLIEEASKYTTEQLASLGKQVREQMGLIGEAAYPLAKRLYQLIHDVYTAQAFDKIAEIEGVIGREGMKGYVKLPDTKRLGKLAGQWVEENLAREIEGIIKTGENPMMKLVDDLNSVWKTLKVPYNPAAVMRNIYSNLLLLWMGDVPVYNPKVVLAGIYEYLKKGDIYKLLRDRGLYGGTYTAQELNELRRTLEVAENPTKGVIEWAVKTFNTPGKVYGAVEDVFKTIAAKYALSKGATPEQAVNFANKWLFDYGKVSRIVETGRRGFFPFITFQAKILPRTLEFIVKKPEKLLLLLGGIEAYNALSRAKLGISKEEEEAQKPQWLKERGTYTLLLPEKDQYGQLQFLDLSYIIPWGAWEQAKEGIPQALMPGGVATILYNAYAGYDPYRGEEIEEEERGKYIASGLLPSLAPGGYGFRKLESAIKQTPDYYGRVRPLETTLLDVLGGIKIQPGGPVETRRQIFEIEEQMQKLKNNLSVIERHPGISPEEKQRQKEKIYQQLKELDTQRQRLALAIGKLPEQLKPREAILSMLKPKETVRIVEGKEEKGGVEELITRGKDKWQRAREIVEAEYYTKEEKQNLLREIGVDDYDEAEVDYFASQGGVELRAEYIKAKLEEIGDDKERLNKFWKLATTPRPNGKKLLTSTVAALLKEQGISVPSTGTGKKKKKVKFQIPSGATKVSPMKIKITMPKLTPPPEITPLTFKTGGIKISQQPTIRLRQIQKPTIKVSWR